MMNSVAFPREALMRPPRASPVYKAIVSVPCPSIPARGTTPRSAMAKTAYDQMSLDTSGRSGTYPICLMRVVESPGDRIEHEKHIDPTIGGCRFETL